MYWLGLGECWRYSTALFDVLCSNASHLAYALEIWPFREYPRELLAGGMTIVRMGHTWLTRASYAAAGLVPLYGNISPGGELY